MENCYSCNKRKNSAGRFFSVLVLSIILFGFSHAAMADELIRGTVTDADTGEPLPGVNIIIEDTETGTTTDPDGYFELSVPDLDQTLFVSFVGFDNQYVDIDGRTEVDIELVPELIEGDEVVITEFGLDRETESLGYSTQQVGDMEIGATGQTSLVDAMQGKVSGVQVTRSSGSPGASSMMLIRGGTSLSGDNQPLFVVDGVPIDNTSAGGRNSPDANRAIDINPADIESINILKGPSAASLYGQRAGEGAVIITTKRGAEGRAVLNYSNTFSFDAVNRVPDLQSRYKQGEQGEFDPDANYSWGPEFEEGDEIYDNLGNFFETAFSQTHDFSVSGGTDQSTFYASASMLDESGIVPNNNDFSRNAFRLNADTWAGENLRFEGSASYTESSRAYVAHGSAGGVMGALFWPRNDDMRNYINDDGTQRTITGSDNPFWTTQMKPYFSDVSRTLLTGSAIYDPFHFLNITYRIGTDRYSDSRQNYQMPGSMSSMDGFLSKSEVNNQITTSTLLITGQAALTESWNSSLTLGHNVEWNNRESLSQSGSGFISPEFVSINNIVEEDRTTSQGTTRSRLVGVFADLDLNWRNVIYFNFRGRNDWSSTLPENNRSFFYPSVSTSVVVNELLNEMGMGIDGYTFSYMRLRASWARVGKDAPPHRLDNQLATSTNWFTIAPQGFISNVNSYFGNPTLKPEFTNSFELGADIRFLDERLALDFTYYRTETDEQILGTRTPPSSSTFLAYVNGGSVRNEGIEAMVNTHPVRGDRFDWRLDVNVSRNRATVEDLPGTLDRVELSDAWSAYSAAQGSAFLDGPLFGINGVVWSRNDDGELLIDDQGYPIVSPTLEKIGNREPDWIGGITNTFSYRTFSLSFTWDARIGGDVFNATENALVRSGLSEKTLNRGETKVFEGIKESTGEPNTQSVVLDQDYYTSILANEGHEFVEDGTWYRLRYITLRYAMPARMLENLPISSLEFRATGRNLILFTNYSGVDPEVSGAGAGVGGAGSFGFDNLGVPATRGFDFGISLSI